MSFRLKSHGFGDETSVVICGNNNTLGNSLQRMQSTKVLSQCSNASSDPDNINSTSRATIMTVSTTTWVDSMLGPCLDLANNANKTFQFLSSLCKLC